MQTERQGHPAAAHPSGDHPAAAHPAADHDAAAAKSDAPATPEQTIVQVPGNIVMWGGFTLTVAPDITYQGMTGRGGWLLTASPPT